MVMGLLCLMESGRATLARTHTLARSWWEGRPHCTACWKIRQGISMASGESSLRSLGARGTRSTQPGCKQQNPDASDQSPDPRADLDFGSTFVLGSSFEQGVLEFAVSLKKPVFGRSWTTVFKAALHAKSLSFGSTSAEKRRRRTLRP